MNRRHRVLRSLGLVLWCAISWAISAVSGEWLLRWLPNGGSVIFLRSALLSILGFLLALGFTDALRPTAEISFNWPRLRYLIPERAEWFAVLFGGAYAALYARFSAQWEYLAGLYNTILATSISMDDSDEQARKKLCVWWAAFIEDADDLHLATKPMFASVIRHLLKEERWRDVVRSFERSSPGGKERLRRIRSRVEVALLVKS